MYADTIDKSKSKKKQIINGTDASEVIKGSKYADKISTGGGYDEIYPGKGKDTIIVNGTGNKEIYIDHGTGNKTIQFESVKNTDKVTICLDYELTPYEYVRSGNNLIIKMYYIKGVKFAYQNLTIKDYFSGEFIPQNLYIQEGEDEDDSEKLSSTLAESGMTITGGKTRTFTGSVYGDLIAGTKKIDTITTSDGNDDIYAGKGNDTITIDGAGTKNITIYNGDGADTIAFSGTNESTANLIFNRVDSVSTETTTEGDLIIYRYHDTGKTVKTEQTTIKNYAAKNDNQTVTINGKAITAFPTLTKSVLNLKKANDVTLTNTTLINNGVAETGNNFQNTMLITGKKADKIASSANNANIFAGAGNDTITANGGSASITAGKGNDIIVLNTTGAVTINHKKGDGSDTISLTEKPSKITLNIKSSLIPDGLTEIEYYNKYLGKLYSNIYSGKLGFKKSGDDLVFSIPNGKKAETITIKDYFTSANIPTGNDFTVSHDYYGEEGESTLTETLHDFGIWTEGKFDGDKNATVFDAVGENRTIYKYTGKGKAIYNGSADNDTYYATLNKKTQIFINDNTKDDNDELTINASKNNVRALFNVNKSGEITITDNSYSDDFIIFNKSSLTAANVKNLLFNNQAVKGIIDIDNFFDNGEENYEGKGYVGNINISTNIVKNMSKYNSGGWKKIFYADTEIWVENVASKVAEWLSANNKETAFDVFENGSAKEINALLNIYKSASNCAVTEGYI